MDIQQALATLGLSEDADRDMIQHAFLKKITLVEGALEEAGSLDEEQHLQAKINTLQQARNLLLAELTSPTASYSHHRGYSPLKDGDIDEFLAGQNNKNGRWLWLLLLLALFGGLGYVYQQGHLDEWITRITQPLSKEQKTARDQGKKLQHRIKTIEHYLVINRGRIDEKVTQAGEANDRTYAPLLRKLKALDKLLESQAYTDALNLHQQADQQYENQAYTDALAQYKQAEKDLATLQTRMNDIISRPITLRSSDQAPRVAQRQSTKTAQPKTSPRPEPATTTPISTPGIRKVVENNPWFAQIIPIMIELPGGRFEMGDRRSKLHVKPEEEQDAIPMHSVKVPRFRLSKYEVSLEHFRHFANQTRYQSEAERNVGEKGCATFDGENRAWQWREGHNWQKPGFKQADDHPVVCLNWRDIQAYINWLNGETGRQFRLPSEAEWEYAVRAGSNSQFYWGDKAGLDNAHCQNCGSTINQWHTVGSKAHKANAYGFFNMSGNAAEWIADCWNDNYQGAPADGSAWKSGDCKKRVLRGGSWFTSNEKVASAFRGKSGHLSYRSSALGFRLAETVPQ